VGAALIYADRRTDMTKLFAIGERACKRTVLLAVCDVKDA
jgi:hypothetical protein